MMNSSTPSFEGSELWTKMWSDMMSQMASSAMNFNAATSPTPPPDPAKQMRDAFLTSWANYCEEFMRSETFLKMMKQSIDGAMEVRGQINKMLRDQLNLQQMPSSGDTEEILVMLHNIEDRVLKQLNGLNARIDALENNTTQGNNTRTSKPRKTKGSES